MVSEEAAYVTTMMESIMESQVNMYTKAVQSGQA